MSDDVAGSGEKYWAPGHHTILYHAMVVFKGPWVVDLACTRSLLCL